MGEFLLEEEFANILSSCSWAALVSHCPDICDASGSSQLPLVSQTLWYKCLHSYPYTLEEVETMSNEAKALEWIIQKTFKVVSQFLVNSGKSLRPLCWGVSTQLTPLSSPVTKSKRALFKWNTTVSVSSMRQYLQREMTSWTWVSKFSFRLWKAKGSQTVEKLPIYKSQLKKGSFHGLPKAKMVAFFVFLFLALESPEGQALQWAKIKLWFWLPTSFISLKIYFSARKTSRTLLGSTLIPTA